jgi:hypothetical protein
MLARNVGCAVSTEVLLSHQTLLGGNNNVIMRFLHFCSFIGFDGVVIDHSPLSHAHTK